MSGAGLGNSWEGEGRARCMLHGDTQRLAVSDTTCVVPTPSHWQLDWRCQVGHESQWVSGPLVGHTAQGPLAQWPHACRRSFQRLGTHTWPPCGRYGHRLAAPATRMSSCMPLGPEVTLLPAMARVQAGPELAPPLSPSDL